MNKPPVEAGQLWKLGKWLFMVVERREYPGEWSVYFFNAPEGPNMQRTMEKYMHNNPDFRFVQ